MEGGARKANLDFILLGDALGDSDDEGNLIVDGFDDCVCRCGRGDIDDGCIGLSFLNGLETCLLSGGTQPFQRKRGLLTSRTLPKTGKPRWV